jgi:glutathione S-transferase
MVAILLQIKMDMRVVDLLTGEHKSAAYLAINPNGKVPLLEDGSFSLWESHAIMQYLADTVGDEALYPKDVQARADINRWLFWSAYHFTPAVGFISRERVSKRMVGGSGEPDPAEIARGEALLAAACDVLDGHLSERRWIAQDRLTLADVAVASPLMHTVAAQLPVESYSHIQRWFEGVRALDAWRKSEPAHAEALRAHLSPITDPAAISARPPGSTAALYPELG